ncbi:MAG: hypothetical protein KDB86_03875, partial [Actinobacteria bacterium]|nr:hypothetical protein [Actinomycetota bacterium]
DSPDHSPSRPDARSAGLGGWCQTRGARLDVPASPLAASSIPPLRTGSDEISSLRLARRIADPHTDV